MRDRKSTSQKVIIIILAVILAIILAFVSVFLVLRILGHQQFHSGDTDISVDSVDNVQTEDGVVYYNDKEYVLNPNIISVLFIGVDKQDVNADLGYGSNGQADSIFVAAIDTLEKSVKIIPISRETMVDVSLYSVTGEYAGTKNEQLCLAYAYGNTPASCSENVKLSVRRMLFGINISSFVTIDLAGVSKITDAVGGVAVKSLEDIEINKKLVLKGQDILLDGSTVEDYIRNRDKDSEANNRRMLRQKQFLSAFASKAGNQIMSDFTKLTEYYNIITPYIATDLSFSQITYLASSCLKPDMGSKIEFKSIPGTSVEGERWTEFTPDTQALLDVVIDVFYQEG